MNRSDNDAVISVRNLTKVFGSFTAVDHISFDVMRGEIFGFLGANGAGKTTAMRMLCGLSYPTSGSGRVAGCDIITQGEDIKQRIGYMSQKFSLYGNMTVMENIRLFATVYGMSDRQIAEATTVLFRDLEMQNMRNTLVRDIPVGWRQKLAFATATIHRPDVVFLDEPTGGVDPITRRRFWELIYKSSTHYLDEAEYCDRVSIMVDGRIDALDSPRELKRKYNASTMDEVFRIVAKDAKRGE